MCCGLSHLSLAFMLQKLVNSESTACKRAVTWLGSVWCGGLISAWMIEQISGWWEARETEWNERGRHRQGDGADWKRQLKRIENVLLTISAVCSMHIVNSIFYEHKIYGWPTTKSKMSWWIIKEYCIPQCKAFNTTFHFWIKQKGCDKHEVMW